MSQIWTADVTITTNGSGAATAYIGPLSDGRSLNGEIVAIEYTKTDFADGVDFTITSETTLQTIWTEANVNAAATKVPRVAAHSTAGVALLVYNDGTRTVPLYAPIFLVNERVKCVIASGGATKTGNIKVYVKQEA